VRTLQNLFVLGVASPLLVGLALGQEAAPESGPRTGPATIGPHWSKYTYPASVAEGVPYHVIEKGDTLWDLAGRYLGSPYLWPQIWDQNRYITDAHWIYPGDPLVLPQVAVVSEEAGGPGPEAGLPGAGGLPEAGLEGLPAAEAGAESQLYPLTEQDTLLCVSYISEQDEDRSLRVIGSEEGQQKVALADRDIIYLTKGANSGVRNGALFTLHRVETSVKHPATGRTIGDRVETTGVARVILVEPDTATAVIEKACRDVLAGDFLQPYEPVNVPLALRRPPSDRLTPASGKANGYIVEVQDHAYSAATGQMVSLDLGSADGLAPGNLLVAYRTVYPNVPTPRSVVGELAVVRVLERTAVAKIIYSRDTIEAGDRVELR